MTDTFNAQNYQPQFGGAAKHPVGMFDFQITNTYGQNTKDNTGGMFVTELSSPAGKVLIRFNLYNSNAQAVEIANKQLAALCHCTGIFNLTFPRSAPTAENPQGGMENFGRELRNARGRMEVGWQAGNEPTADNPAGGYVEVKRLFDSQGNEPGKPRAATAPMMQPGIQPAPQQQQPAPQQGWGPPPQQQAQPIQQQQPGWNNNAAQGQPQQGWAQGAAPGPNAAPPWGQR